MVVFFVGADPKPGDDISITQADGAVMASGNARASCQSRQFRKPAGADVFLYLIQQRPQSAAFRKVGVNLLIPSCIFTLSDERG